MESNGGVVDDDWNPRAYDDGSDEDDEDFYEEDFELERKGGSASNNIEAIQPKKHVLQSIDSKVVFICFSFLVSQFILRSNWI